MVEKRTSGLVRDQTIPENEQVAIAMHPGMMGPLLEQLFQPEPGETEGQNGATGTKSRPPECHILDVKYEPGNYCRILYQLGDDLIIGTYKWEGDESQIPETTRVIPSLGM